ncbi:hypothetical protein LB566_09290 [Mesorhizobium sp. CA13]|uniref:hypothetical protein n=1 Tax=Mesorhizobium sp. CA13 TaxID=2876643 RepID=UPI001CCBAC57|nr:hypothetical protein [Mesorhizobium sp. CA13]MBZ9853993.1 hypothetical protein [Mesorhizobium sp. CA13]
MPIAEELSRLHSANIDIGTLSLVSKLSTKIAIRSMFRNEGTPNPRLRRWPVPRQIRSVAGAVRGPGDARLEANRIKITDTYIDYLRFSSGFHTQKNCLPGVA